MKNSCELLAELIEASTASHGGHMTIMRFTTNWRVGFGTPRNWQSIQGMACGATFAEAAQRALDMRLGELIRKGGRYEMRGARPNDAAAFESVLMQAVCFCQSLGIERGIDGRWRVRFSHKDEIMAEGEGETLAEAEREALAEI